MESRRPNTESEQTLGESSAEAARPDVRRYSDYRVYLNDFVAYLRTQDAKFSFRRFGRAAGFASPNYLKLVMDGDRNLSAESAPRFVVGLGLAKEEGEVFNCLVELSLAKHDVARNAIFESLRDRTRGDDLALLRDDQFAVYGDWWPLVVRDMASLPDFQCNSDWIARNLRPKITPARAQAAIDLLLRLGLWRRDEATGQAGNADRTISSGLLPNEIQGLAIRNYHRAILALAAKSLDDISREERNVTSAIATFDGTTYPLAVEIVTRARRELLELAEETRHSDGEMAGNAAVFQTVFAIFPVTLGEKK